MSSYRTEDILNALDRAEYPPITVTMPTPESRVAAREASGGYGVREALSRKRRDVAARMHSTATAAIAASLNSAADFLEKAQDYPTRNIGNSEYKPLTDEWGQHAIEPYLHAQKDKQ